MPLIATSRMCFASEMLPPARGCCRICTQAPRTRRRSRTLTRCSASLGCRRIRKLKPSTIAPRWRRFASPSRRQSIPQPPRNFPISIIPTRQALRVPLAASGAAHGLHGCCAQAGRRPYSRAAAREEFLRRNLAVNHRRTYCGWIPGGGAGPDRLLQVHEARALPIQFPRAGAQYTRAAELAWAG